MSRPRAGDRVIVYRFAVALPVAVDEDFPADVAEAAETQRALEKALYAHLQRWEEYPHAADVELVEYEIAPAEPEPERDETYERLAARAALDGFEATGGRDWR